MKTAAWIGVIALATAGVAACGDDTSDTTGSGASGSTATTGTTTTGTTTTTATTATGTGGAGGEGGGVGGAGGGAGGEGGGSGLLPFGSPCTNNAECESNICNAQQGTMVCTVTCQNDNECPPPMDCNNNGFCKP